VVLDDWSFDEFFVELGDDAFDEFDDDVPTLAAGRVASLVVDLFE
jgi:hypothetical protein